MSTLFKHSTLTASLLGFLGMGSLALISPVQASVITNGGFETGDFTGWMTTGDTSVQGTFDRSLQFGPILPPGGNFQAVLTTGCPAATIGICQDRNEDQNAPQGTYNYSGNSVTQADPSLEPALQTFLGLDSNGLSIPDNIDQFLPKEGSAIKQTITSPTPFQISFKYNFLSNDGDDEIFGPNDYGFVTIHREDVTGTVADVIVLEQSTNVPRTGFPSDPVPPNGDYSYDNQPYDMFMSQVLPAGTYTLGIGVVDGYDRDSTSALLIDQIEKTNITQVPEPTSTVALLGLGSLGLILKRKKGQA